MKKWYNSKTIIVNGIALIAVILQGIYGKEVISPEIQGAVLAVINLIVRKFTKYPLS